jgi:hypothetical protein
MNAINIKAYTVDTSQIEAIKAFMKALKIKFEVSKEPHSKLISAEKSLIVEEIREAVDSLRLIREGKLTARPAKDLLNEL